MSWLDDVDSDFLEEFVRVCRESDSLRGVLRVLRSRPGWGMTRLRDIKEYYFEMLSIGVHLPLLR